MATSGIQGQVLEITVVGARNLKDTEWISRQDPYVVVEYANNKFRTKTDTDGGKNPSFNDKFMLPLIEGLREVNIQVWNSNLGFDDFIGHGKILLEKALTTGFDDNAWSISSKSGKYAGEVKTILHFANAGKTQSQKVKQEASHAPAAPPYPHPYPVPYPAFVAPQQSYAGYPPYAPPAGYAPPAPYPAPVPHGVPPPPYSAPAGYSAPPYPSSSGPAAYYGAPAPGYPPPSYPGQGYYPQHW